MKALIIGCGGVGLALASFLSHTDCQPILLARPKTAALLRQDGLKMSGIFGSRHIIPSHLHVIEKLSELTTLPDIICVCVKSYVNPEIVTMLQASGMQAALFPPLVLFQNGWGGHIPFSKAFGETLVFSARLLTGFVAQEPNQVEITVHGDAARLGSLYGHRQDRVDQLAIALSRGGYSALVVPDVIKDIWGKMLYNCALNSLGALLDIPYGRLAESAESRAVMDDIVFEIFAVMTAAGIVTHWQTPDLFLENFYCSMLPRTAQHISSTLQDIRRGIPTEIDFLNGAIVREGAAHGISTPINATLTRLIKFTELFGKLKK